MLCKFCKVLVFLVLMKTIGDVGRMRTRGDIV
jgi:hypothetical protein